MFLDASLKNYTAEIAAKGLLRTRSIADSGLISFDSNDYLSLGRHPQIIKAYQQGYELFPVGSGGSMVLNGYHASHQAVEREFSSWLKLDECVLFSSGYAANLAVMSLLGKLAAQVLIDKGAHASIYDGLQLARVEYKRFFHNDLEDLKRQLASKDVLLTEGIFSMSGQMPPLDELSILCTQNKLELLVDEAHAIGILGQEGQGAVVHHGLSQKEVPLRIIPLGKAFAGQGAIVAGDALWIQALLQAARSLIYSTAISPAMSFGLLKTLEVVRDADERRLKLQNLIQYFRECIQNSPFTWTDSITPIQQVQFGSPHMALNYTAALKQQGINCSAIRQPTVSLKASGLRIILNYQHEPEHIKQLFNKLNNIYENSSI